MKDLKVTLVVPTIKQDIDKILGNITIFFEFLPISRIILLCKRELVDSEIHDGRIEIINEDDIINFAEIREAMLRRSNTSDVERRVGWYYQQFLKMAFARITNDDYYLLWDSDTVPVKDIKLFNNAGLPFLDYKREFHAPYFTTISALLPRYAKSFKGSFIAEHMLVNASHMRRLLSEIESNSSLAGNQFYEKIINSIEIQHLSGSGFSEFETFGTWLYKNHKEDYELRRWRSSRNGGVFLKTQDLNDPAILSWLSKSLDAVSFEKHNELTKLREYVLKETFRKFCSAATVDKVFKLYKKICV